MAEATHSLTHFYFYRLNFTPSLHSCLFIYKIQVHTLVRLIIMARHHFTLLSNSDVSSSAQDHHRHDLSLIILQ
jgi:hypothetical protein